MKVIAMIPARLGSQRLKKKNLKLLSGIPLISHAIRKAKKVALFDEVWVNSESQEIGQIATQEQADFHERPAELANDSATSEDFVYEFLKAHPCDYLVQVHSIAPLVKRKELDEFTHALIENEHDVLLSGVNEQIECMMDFQPVNFDFSKKSNSQDLKPIQRVTWSITGWKTSSYIAAYEKKQSATFAGKVGFYPLNRMAGHIIKTQQDLDLAEVYLKESE